MAVQSLSGNPRHHLNGRVSMDGVVSRSISYFSHRRGSSRYVDYYVVLDYNYGITDYGLLGLPWDYSKDCTRLQGSV